MISSEQNLPHYQASAPGKVILCGEYSVLAGHPALVLGVDRRVELSLTPSLVPGLTVTTAGFSQPSATLQWDAVRGCFARHSDSLAMVVDTLNLLIAKLGLEETFCDKAWHLQIDSSALFDDSRSNRASKLGLGSSAAITAALAGLLQALLNGRRLSQNELWSLLQPIHSLVQGKRGSGVDLAASITGGSCCFTNQQDRSVDIRQRDLPKNLHLRFIWTGESASTPEFLNSLSLWKTENVQQFNEHMLALGSASSLACDTNDRSLFLAHVREFTASPSGIEKAPITFSIIRFA